MRRLLIAVAALLTLLFFASCSRTETGRGTTSATGRDGKAVAVGPEAGKITLLHFWATWCGPCKYELPSFVEFAKASEGPKLRWVAVANDPDFGVVDEHLRGAGIAMDTLLDPHGAALRGWQVQAIPTTIVLDGNGKELARYVGMHDWNDPKQREEVLALAR